MMADPRATDALVNNFAAQWLNLRRVEEVVVDPLRYPNYDLSLMQAFQQETELFVASTIHEDRRVPESAERRLHLRQRAPGSSVRDSRGLRKPLPARHRAESRSARRSARGRRAAGDDLVSGPHLAGAARQVAAEQHLRPADSAAASRRRHQHRQQAGCDRRNRFASVSRSIGKTPRAIVVTRHRSARFRAREL